MRSRYTAYTRADIDYLFESHLPSTRGEFDREAARAWARSSEWLGLKVVAVEAGVHGDGDPNAASVEFVARFKRDGKTERHHEHSHFSRVDGRWYYAGGHTIANQTMVRQAVKVGRNDPCSCGSGKKFKKCCGRAG